MQTKLVSWIALKLFAVIIGVIGIYHFADPNNLAIQVPNFIPGGSIWVYIVGVALLLASIAFLFNIKVKLAGYLLAALLIIFALTIHLRNFFELVGEDKRSVSFMIMLRDLALACCTLYIADSSSPQEPEEPTGTTL